MELTESILMDSVVDIPRMEVMRGELMLVTLLRCQ